MFQTIPAGMGAAADPGTRPTGRPRVRTALRPPKTPAMEKLYPWRDADSTQIRMIRLRCSICSRGASRPGDVVPVGGAKFSSASSSSPSRLTTALSRAVPRSSRRGRRPRRPEPAGGIVRGDDPGAAAGEVAGQVGNDVGRAACRANRRFLRREQLTYSPSPSFMGRGSRESSMTLQGSKVRAFDGSEAARFDRCPRFAKPVGSPAFQKSQIPWPPTLTPGRQASIPCTPRRSPGR